MTLDSDDNIPPGCPNDHPDLDFYAHARWINELIFFVLLCIIATTVTLVAFYAAVEASLVIVLAPRLWELWAWLPILDTIVLSSFVLYCLLLADEDYNSGGLSFRGSHVPSGFPRSQIHRVYTQLFVRLTRAAFPYILFVTVLAYLRVLAGVPYVDDVRQPLLLVLITWYVFMCCMGRVAEI